MGTSTGQHGNRDLPRSVKHTHYLVSVPSSCCILFRCSCLGAEEKDRNGLANTAVAGSHCSCMRDSPSSRVRSGCCHSGDYCGTFGSHAGYVCRPQDDERSLAFSRLIQRTSHSETKQTDQATSKHFGILQGMRSSSIRQSQIIDTFLRCCQIL